MNDVEKLARIARTSPTAIKAIGMSERAIHKTVRRIFIWRTVRISVFILALAVAAATIEFKGPETIFMIAGMTAFAAVFAGWIYDPSDIARKNALRDVVRHISGHDTPKSNYKSLAELIDVSPEQIESLRIGEKQIRHLVWRRSIGNAAAVTLITVGIVGFGFIGYHNETEHPKEMDRRHSTARMPHLTGAGVFIAIFFVGLCLGQDEATRKKLMQYSTQVLDARHSTADERPHRLC